MTEGEEAQGSAPAGNSGSSPARFSLLEAGSKQVRQAATWLVGVLAAVAAALIAGTQLSGIGKIEDPRRLLLAALSAAVVLGGVGVIIWLLLEIMVPSSRALSEATGKFATDHQEVFRGYAKDGPCLQIAYVNALEDRADAIRGNLAMPPTVSDWETNAAQYLADDIGSAVQDVLALRTYKSLEEKLTDNWRRLVLFVTAALVGLAIIGLVFAVNPPEKQTAPPSQSTTASLVGAELSFRDLNGVSLPGADLHGANLGGAQLRWANLTDADLRNVNLRGADLTNANLKGARMSGAVLLEVTWGNTTCPDGELAVPPETCEKHLAVK